jgi:arylsulfatase
MIGTRGLWQEGWKVAATHAPITGHGHFDQDKWELYHVDNDRSESKNVADQYPDKVKELVDAWFEEAEANYGLPIDDRTAMDQLTIDRPSSEPSRNRYLYYPGSGAVPEGVAVNVRGRSYKIIADVEVEEGSEGVIFAHGSRFGGHALFIKDGKLHYVYNFLGIPPEQEFVSEKLTSGKHALGVEFIREGAGEHRESVGTAKLYVDDQVVDQGPMRTQTGKFTLCGDGLCVGFDSGDTVSRKYTNPFPFTGGTILGVGIDVSDEQYLDLELEALAAYARE